MTCIKFFVFVRPFHVIPPNKWPTVARIPRMKMTVMVAVLVMKKMMIMFHFLLLRKHFIGWLQSDMDIDCVYTLGDCPRDCWSTLNYEQHGWLLILLRLPDFVWIRQQPCLWKIPDWRTFLYFYGFCLFVCLFCLCQQLPIVRSARNICIFLFKFVLMSAMEKKKV